MSTAHRASASAVVAESSVRDAGLRAPLLARIRSPALEGIHPAALEGEMTEGKALAQHLEESARYRGPDVRSSRRLNTQDVCADRSARP
jgi:hypothetical protein